MSPLNDDFHPGIKLCKSVGQNSWWLQYSAVLPLNDSFHPGIKHRKSVGQNSGRLQSSATSPWFLSVTATDCF